MKKIVSLILCVVIFLSVTACVKEDKSRPTSSKSMPTSSTVAVDIVKQASKGIIDGCEFGIGTNPETIKEAYHYGDEEYWGTNEDASSKHNIDAVELDIREGDPVRMTTGDTKYYYHVADQDKGISFIAYFYDAYSLRLGISDTQTVKDAVKAKPVFDGFANEEDLFFFFGEPTDVYALTYKFDDMELSFYFMDGKLSATTLKKVSVWG